MLSLTPRTNFGALSFNDFVDDMFSSPFFRGSRTQMPSMKTDIKEKDGMYLLDIDLPGFEKENIKAELNDGYLTISAARNTSEDKSDEESGYVYRERSCGSCSGAIRPPAIVPNSREVSSKETCAVSPSTAAAIPAIVSGATTVSSA